MMQLLCNNVALDLYDNTNLQFKSTNPLFAFDKMECERTTQFKLPSTPKNDEVFALARIPAYKGEGMRQKFDAQLQAGTIIKDGFLYISQYDGKDYNAIFVTGELLGLKRIRDLGKINECGIFDNYIDVVEAAQGGAESADGDSAYSMRNTLWANVHYKRGGNLHPSINLTMLLSAMGVTDSAHILDSLNLRWIPSKMNPVQDDYLLYDVYFKNVSEGSYVPEQGQALNVSYFSIVQQGEQRYIDNAFFGGNRVMVGYSSGGTNYRGYMAQKVTKFETTLGFAGDFPSDCFLGYFNPQTDITQKYTQLSDFHFLGGYSFDANGNVSGTELKAQWITIPAGTSFCIIRKSWWTSTGWNVSTPNFNIPYNHVVFTQMKENPPKIWRLKDNLPDCTAVDFLKAAAAMTGCVLRYTDATGIMLDPIITDGAIVDVTDKVISTGEVARKFGDYGQHNIVHFAEDESLYSSEIDITDYSVENVNLEARKILQTMPASNGGIYEEHVNEQQETWQTLIVRGEEPSADTFAKYDEHDHIHLSRVGLEKMTDIQDLCDASTSLVISVRMTLLEYNNIVEKTQLQYNGTLYMWTDKTWQKDVAKFTLAKLQQSQ